MGYRCGSLSLRRYSGFLDFLDQGCSCFAFKLGVAPDDEPVLNYNKGRVGIGTTQGIRQPNQSRKHKFMRVPHVKDPIKHFRVVRTRVRRSGCRSRRTMHAMRQGYRGRRSPCGHLRHLDHDGANASVDASKDWLVIHPKLTIPQTYAVELSNHLPYQTVVKRKRWVGGKRTVL